MTRLFGAHAVEDLLGSPVGERSDHGEQPITDPVLTEDHECYVLVPFGPARSDRNELARALAREL